MLLTSSSGHSLLRLRPIEHCVWRSLQRREACRCRGSTTAQQPLAVPSPPADYDYKAEILPETVSVVKDLYPDLIGLVDQGNLVVYARPANYTERRTDGYQEPQLIFIVGTAHVSQQSAADVEQVIAAVQPQAVVVELCKSRVGILHVLEDSSNQQVTASAGDQLHQDQQAGQSDSASSFSPPIKESSALQDRLDSHQQASSTGNGTANTPAAAYWARRHKTAASLASSNSKTDLNTISSDVSRQQAYLRHAEMGSDSRSNAVNPLSLSGSSFPSALVRSAQLGGQSGLLLRVLLAGQQHKIADQLGVQPGAEFRAAARAADAVDASLVLGDRPIEITLQRAWGALSWWRRLSLLKDLLTTSWGTDRHVQKLTPEVVEKLRSDDDISTVFKSLGKAYPELIDPLIAERDLYLAWSLKRSKAVNGTRTVVGVVGKGHLRGVVYALKHDNGKVRFADLVGGKNKKKTLQDQTAALARRLLLDVWIAAGLYAVWVAISALTRQ